MLSTLSSKVLNAENKAVYKYFLNGINKINHVASLVFLYDIWLVVIFISIKVTSNKSINKNVIFIHPL